MNTIRQRAKDHLPTVLLTLLSIVQALALELLWSHLQESPYLFDISWQAFVYWTQILATLMGLILIWIIYASNAIRFRWVPTIADSVYPFLIGLLEFMLVAALGPEHIGLWFILLAAVFGLMNWITHATMRRARSDGENDAFFSQMEPATYRDFAPALVIVAAMVLMGVYLLVSDNRGAPVLLALLMTTIIMAWHFLLAKMFWDMSVSAE